jgi:predicted  nucleic acid-binding Zn-ribbon protein
VTDATFGQTVLIALIGSGVWALVAAVFRLLRHGKAENSALIAKGAADAVVSLEKALQAEQAEVRDLRKQLSAEREKAHLRDNKIEALENEVGELRSKLRAIESDAKRMHEELTSLRKKG